MYETYGIYNGEVHRISFAGNGIIALYPNSESERDETYTDRYNTGNYSGLIAAAVLFGIAESAFLLITAKIVMLIKGVG